jgi:hypothetical protein
MVLADPVYHIYNHIEINMYRVGQKRKSVPYMTDRMYGDFPAKNTVCTPYIPINVWFWPTLNNYKTFVNEKCTLHR